MTALTNLDMLTTGDVVYLSVMRRVVYDGNGMAHAEVANVTGQSGAAKYNWNVAGPGSMPMTQAMVDKFIELKR